MGFVLIILRGDLVLDHHPRHRVSGNQGAVMPKACSRTTRLVIRDLYLSIG
jgi:hypothetical protein